ncbi:MAG TPA: SDR family NAD(P)-dependent oxidoreductase [Thermoleophilaceae bacterium]|nr:SDR family NAD(P)-dependent oxidoreductase [Thermoleophilaceae bacterium]
MAPAPDLSGRIALLTGATGGIGNAIARALHRQGAAVKLSGRRAEVLEELASELGDRAEVLPADLSNPTDVDALADRAGAVDVLVNNAALPGSGPLTDYSPEEVDRALAVNLHAPIRLTHALLPGMLERGSGNLVYIASISGKVPAGGASIYSATKFGLRGFAFSLHEELRGKGIGVTTVFPGFIRDAGMFADTELKLPPGAGTRTPEQVADGVLTGIATNRAELDVAALPQRLGGRLFGPLPRLVAWSVRATGGERLAERMSEAQRVKR